MQLLSTGKLHQTQALSGPVYTANSASFRPCCDTPPQWLPDYVVTKDSRMSDADGVFAGTGAGVQYNVLPEEKCGEWVPVT